MTEDKTELTNEQISALTTQMVTVSAEEAAKALHAKKLQHMAELAQNVPHYEQTMHKNDRPHPKTKDGKRTHVAVRVDGGDSETPAGERQYWLVPAGYGEARRAANARAAHKAGKSGCASMSTSHVGTDRDIVVTRKEER